MTKTKDEVESTQNIFLPIVLPPKEYLVETFPRSHPKTPIDHFLHSIEDYRNWFYQISLLFDENNKFTLINQDRFLESNFAEKYAFALFQNGKVNLSFDLFSGFPETLTVFSFTNEDGRIIYPNFGACNQNLGILGVETYIKVCSIKQQKERGLLLSIKIIEAVEKDLFLNSEKLIYNKTLYKALVYAYNFIIYHTDGKVKRNYKNRKFRNLKTLNNVWGVKQNLSNKDLAKLWENVIAKSTEEAKKYENYTSVDESQLSRKYNV